MIIWIQFYLIGLSERKLRTLTENWKNYELSSRQFFWGISIFKEAVSGWAFRYSIADWRFNGESGELGRFLKSCSISWKSCSVSTVSRKLQPFKYFGASTCLILKEDGWLWNQVGTCSRYRTLSYLSNFFQSFKPNDFTGTTERNCTTRNREVGFIGKMGLNEWP